MLQQTVAEALAEARTLVTADGGDLELTAIDAASSTVNVRLVLDGVDCHECVMPRPILEQMFTDMFQSTVPDLARVVVDDPREHPDYVAPGTD